MTMQLYCDLNLSNDELTALLSCIQLTEDTKRETIESLCGDVKLAGLQTKIAEAIQENINFYELIANEESTETTEESN